MMLMGAVMVFLLGTIAGLLVGLFMQGARRGRLADESAARAVEAEDGAERRHNERRAHLDAVAAVLVSRMETAAKGIGAELRDSATQFRNDLRLAVGLVPVRVPREWRSPDPAPISVSRARCASCERSTPSAASSARAATSSGMDDHTLLFRDNETTPPSGWTLEEVRAHTAQHDLASEDVAP